MDATWTPFDPARPTETGLVSLLFDAAREKVAEVNPGIDMSSPAALTAVVRTTATLAPAFIEKVEQTDGPKKAAQARTQLQRELDIINAA